MEHSSADSLGPPSSPSNHSMEKRENLGEVFEKEMKSHETSTSRSGSFVSAQDETKSAARRWKTLVLENKYTGYFLNWTKRREEDSGAQGRRPWKATFLRFGPVSGIFCMLLAAAALVASLGILAGSDGQAVNDWTAPPSTYLAIFTAIANLSIRYAAAQGVIVAWWVRASRGMKTSDLHWIWSSGTSIKVETLIKRLSRKVIDGPLLQRASTVVQAPPQPTLLNISMTEELPDGYTGLWSSAAQLGSPGKRWSFLWNDTIPTIDGSISNFIWPTSYMSPMEAVTGNWLAGRSLTNLVSGCSKSSSCTVKIKAPALWPTSCTKHTHTIDYAAPMHVNAIWQEQYAAPLSHDVFFIDSALDLSGEQEKINLITGFTTTEEDCSQFTLNYTLCTLQSAIGEYDVSIQGKNVDMESMGMPSLVRLAENAVVNDTWNSELGGHTSTLAGIVASMNDKWNCVLVQYKSGNQVNGMTFQQTSFEEYALPGSPRCPSFRDPQQDVLRSLNQFMFYLGASAAGLDRASLSHTMDPDVPVITRYTAPGSVQVHESVFTTNYWYFAGAAIVVILCIFVILPTYWNWWTLGRPVSFSPLEMAKAFESPMFDHCNSNSSGRDLAELMGEQEVRYGLVQSPRMSDTSKVAFANGACVRTPKEGTLFEE